MPLTLTQVGGILSTWIKPSSDSEQERQDRAERMIREAIQASPSFAGTNISIYAKGSYANNTNVRLDSDVDIVVQCDDCEYYDYAQGVQPQVTRSPYVGQWTPEVWRFEVVRALRSHFGASEVDATGQVAIGISEKPGSRPNADVVPSFGYRLYWAGDRSAWSEGSVVFRTDGTRITNWPAQQLANGQQKNVRTGRRYKAFARALKNAENYLVENDGISAKASYLMECLAYNVKDETLQVGTLVEGFRATLLELWLGIEGDDHTHWLEPNEIKYVFRGTQKWTREDARQVVAGAWKYLFA